MNKNGIRTLLSAASIVLAAFCGTAQSQPYPTKPVKFIVPFPPGGNLDFVARTLQPKFSEFLGQPVVIDNRGGAGGIVGAEYASKQPNDGYTILLGNTGTFGIYPVVYPKLSYDALKDFNAVGITSTNAVLATIGAAVPANTLQEFIAYVKANPGKVAAGVAGTGSLLHFATEMLKSRTGIDLLVVPYKASGPAATDLLGGQIQLLIDAPPVAMPYVKAGRVKAIAVSGKTRLATLPDTPTFEEAGLKDFDASGWQGVLVPAGTPPAAIAKLNEALVKTLALTEVREKFATQGLDAASGTPAEFAAFIRAENEKWGKVAKTANIKLD
ncbi:MAG: Bug family tripartite tricarboxylate transporter substrate binding protein [Burkholderiales bacterium]